MALAAMPGIWAANKVMGYALEVLEEVGVVSHTHLGHRSPT
jgi:hypothetical protein